MNKVNVRESQASYNPNSSFLDRLNPYLNNESTTKLKSPKTLNNAPYASA